MTRVVAAIIVRRHRLLICRRLATGPFPLQWEFPGGKMRPSETPRQALARELREELGISARIGRPIARIRYRYAEMPRAVELLFFAARLPPGGLPGSIPRNLVFDRIAWVAPGDLPRYDFLAADRKLIARLARSGLPIA